MTHRADDANVPVLIIKDEPHDTCELCGVNDELRPYGPGGKYVCFDCMMKNEAEGKRQFAKRLSGIEPEPREAKR